MPLVSKLTARGVHPTFSLNIFIKAKISLGILLLIWLYCFWPSISIMLKQYTLTSCNMHGFLIIPLFLSLLVVHSPSLTRISSSSSNFGMLVILINSFIWLLANIAKITLLEQFLLLTFIPLTILANFGNKTTSILNYPLIFLYCLLPIGDIIGKITYAITKEGIMLGADLLRIPIYWDTTNLYFGKETPLTIAFAGLKYSMLWVTISMWLNYFLNTTLLRRLFFTINHLLLSIGLHIIFYLSYLRLQLSSNYIFSNNSLVVISSGLIILTFVINAIIAFTISIKNPIKNHHDIDWRHQYNNKNMRWFKPTVLISCIFIIIPYVSNHISKQSWDFLGTIKLTAPALENWHQTDNHTITTSWQPIFTNNNGQINITYQKNNNKVILSAAHYSHTNFSNSLLNSANKWYQPEHWQKITQHTRTVHSSPHNFQVSEILLRNNNNYHLVWYYYHINGKITSSTFIAKIFDGIRILLRSSSNSGIITISTETSLDIDIARELLANFAINLHPHLDKFLGPSRKMN